jgi:hypothetical protein
MVIDLEIRLPNKLFRRDRKIALERWNTFLRDHQKGLHPRAECGFNLPDGSKWVIAAPNMSLMLSKDNKRVLVVIWMDGVIRSVLPDDELLPDFKLIADFFGAEVFTTSREGDFDGLPTVRFPQGTVSEIDTQSA